MNQDWQTFLSSQHAHINDGVVAHFGDQSAELKHTASSTVLCDLSQYGLLRASGEEAQGFLQNLLSNDIRFVDATHAQLSSFNTAKGRMLAVFTIWRDGEDYLLQLPSSILEALRKKLSMYVLRTKVKISDASNEYVSLGLSGKDASALLSTISTELPQEVMGCVNHAGVHILKLDATRFQLTTSVEQAQTLWNALSKDARPVGSVCWDSLNVRAGIPSIVPKTQEEFVPQMANLDALGGINFKKGCYPGQEIVARMHYLGKLKRRMYLAHLDGSEAPQPGDELFSDDMEGQASGMIANVAPAPEGGYDILAVIQTASVEGYKLRTANNTELNILPLPYTLA